MAETFNCKYIEVSAILNHKVDDLLVGTLKQIRMNPRHRRGHGGHVGGAMAGEREEEKRNKRMTECDLLQAGRCLTPTKDNILVRMLKGAKRISKSCENLFAI